MASNNIIPNDAEPKSPLIIVSLPNIIKLNSTNYLSWKLQIEATLVGYGLFQFVDGSSPCPSKTITATDSSTQTNPAYSTWMRQDRLLYGTLIGTLDQTVVPLVSLTKTSKELWDTLARTYASASRGHIQQLKAKFKNITKGPQSITEFMNSIKACTDELALLGEPMKSEDITDRGGPRNLRMGEHNSTAQLYGSDRSKSNESNESIIRVGSDQKFEGKVDFVHLFQLFEVEERCIHNFD